MSSQPGNWKSSIVPSASDGSGPSSERRTCDGCADRPRLADRTRPGFRRAPQSPARHRGRVHRVLRLRVRGRAVHARHVRGVRHHRLRHPLRRQRAARAAHAHVPRGVAGGPRAGRRRHGHGPLDPRRGGRDARRGVRGGARPRDRAGHRRDRGLPAPLGPQHARRRGGPVGCRRRCDRGRAKIASPSGTFASSQSASLGAPARYFFTARPNCRSASGRSGRRRSPAGRPPPPLESRAWARRPGRS